MALRTLLGLSIASGLEGVDVAVVRASGLGLELAPRADRTARLPFPPAVRDLIRAGGSSPPPELLPRIADAVAQAVRHATAASGVSVREVMIAGFLEPARPPGFLAGVGWAHVADRVAEQTGLTTAHSFRGRDQAAGGSGQAITAAADYLFFRSPTEERVLIHLGSVASVLLIPPAAKVSAVLGFEAGPGNHLLDGFLVHGTRGKESTDPGGKRAVQGCCLEPLLTAWRDHPHVTRRPPKAVPPEAFGRGFLQSAFDAARAAGASLPDLLCTATHFIARCVGAGCRQWLPAAAGPRRVYLSGGGVRNGLLWQLLGQPFEGQAVARLDETGVPALARGAAGAAVMAALLLDGVNGNLPLLTGASGGRLCGQIAPGDTRNWSRCLAWMAEQATDPRQSRAA